MKSAPGCLKLWRYMTLNETVGYQVNLSFLGIHFLAQLCVLFTIKTYFNNLKLLLFNILII